MGNCLAGFDAAHQSVFAGPWQRLESGLNHQCGLKADGSIECWGDNLVDDQLNNMPASTETFRAFSVGWNHACAIKGDGTLACWGSNLNGQATPPTGAFVQVAAGNTFTCAIRDVGTRVCWGSDAAGQAPQLTLSPGLLPSGAAATVYAGAQFVLTDNAPDADGDYVPPTPAFAVTVGALPDGLTLSATGALSGTPTASGSFPFTVEAEDANGFTTSREYSITVIGDSTGPEISYLLNPLSPDGDNGWYVSDVGIAWTVTDAESAITNSTGCNATTLASDTLGATYTCSASSAGGSNSVETASIKRDATKPTASAATTSAADGSNGWYRSNVGVHFTCADATSGIATCPADQSLSSEGSAVSSSAQTATDNAGNSSDPSNIVTVKIDKTAPTLAPTVPNPLLRDGSYSASPHASDAVSGVASSNCGPLDTSSTGTRSVTCNAADNAGNTNSVALSYTVTTSCANDGYKSTQLTWCQNICENSLSGQVLDTWLHRWNGRYRDLPYCRVDAE